MNTHSLAKKGRPFEDYTWMVNLSETDHNIVYWTVNWSGNVDDSDNNIDLLILHLLILHYGYLIQILKLTNGFYI